MRKKKNKKRQKNHKKPDTKQNNAIASVSPGRQPEMDKKAINNHKTHSDLYLSNKRQYLSFLKKITVDRMGVFVAILAFIVTGWNVYLTRQTLHTSQRAFLYHKETKVVAQPHLLGDHLNTPLYLEITWENSGETPARRAVFYVESCSRTGWPREDFSFPYKIRDNPPRLVPPKGTVITTVELPKDSLRDVELGTKNMIVYGTVEYYDIFDRRHKTEFCIKYNGWKTNDTTDFVEKYHWDSYKEHNCHDDDCPTQWGKSGIDCCS